MSVTVETIQCKKCGGALVKSRGRSWRVCNSCWNIYHMERYRRLRTEAVKILGGRCVRCGIEDTRVLRIKPIDAGIKTDVAFFTWVIKDPASVDSTRYPVFCLNCMEVAQYER